MLREACMLSMRVFSLYTYTHWSPEQLQQQTCTLLKWSAALHKASVHFHSCTPISNSEWRAGWGKKEIRRQWSDTDTRSGHSSTISKITFWENIRVLPPKPTQAYAIQALPYCRSHFSHTTAVPFLLVKASTLH